MSRSQKQYLLDILTAMDDARRFVEDLTFEELEGDQRTQYALQRTFEIIGEAAKQIDDSVRERHSHIPWRKMAGMRDMIVHEYFAVNLEVVWDTVHEDFPRVCSDLQKAYEALPDEDA